MDYIFMGRNSGSMDIHFCADYCLMKIRDVYTFMVRVSSSSYRSRESFGMGVFGCSVAVRKYHIGKSAMVRKISIT